jgi:hypothetical protein
MASVPPVAPMIWKEMQDNDPMAAYQRMSELTARLNAARQDAQIKQQQIQAGQQENQQRQFAIDDQTNWRRAMQEANGDPDKTFDLARKYGVSPQSLQTIQNNTLEYKTKLMGYNDAQRKVVMANNDAMQGAHDAIDKASPEQKPQVYQQQLGQLKQLGLDVSQMPPQYPGDESFASIGPMLKLHSQISEEAFKQSETGKNTAQGREASANAAQKEAQTAAYQGSGIAPGISPEQQAMAAYLRSVPGARPENYSAWKAQQEAIATAPEKLALATAEGRARAAEAGPARDAARADRSYQFNSAQLDKVGQPIEQALTRFGRLQDTLNQATPQADALVAPELLTVMAGGQGSGLRMNEAEIARVVGGRSNFESLKAALNKWQLDPSKALSITPSQRQQIRGLMNEVQGKLLRKQNILDQARQDLINADNPIEHRKVLAGARQQLTAIDEGGQGATGVQRQSSYPPPGATMKVPGSDGHLHWSDGKKDLGIAE